MERIQKIKIPDELGSLQPEIPAIGICNNSPAADVIANVVKYRIKHIVQSTQSFWQTEVKTAEAMLNHVDQYLDFPISTILSPDSISSEAELKLKLFEKRFCKADEKVDILKGIEVSLRKMKRSSSFIGEINLVADELFTNAIYNAPHVSFAINRSGAERTKENGNMAGIREARIFLGADSTRIVIGCEDAYGSLNPDKLVEKLQVCFQEGAGKAINFGEGGAGLGTFMIFRSALAMYVGVSLGQRTVVCCTFPSTPGRLETLQNIHLACTGKNSEKRTEPAPLLREDGPNRMCVEFVDMIDEHVEFPKEIPDTVTSISVDFGKVSYINSVGLRHWIKWTKEIEGRKPALKLEIKRAVTSFIRACEISVEVLPGNATVKSYYFDYFCPTCNESTHALVENKKSNNPESVKCGRCSGDVEPEVSEAAYRSLIKHAAE